MRSGLKMMLGMILALLVVGAKTGTGLAQDGPHDEWCAPRTTWRGPGPSMQADDVADSLAARLVALAPGARAEESARFQSAGPPDARAPELAFDTLGTDLLLAVHDSWNHVALRIIGPNDWQTVRTCTRDTTQEALNGFRFMDCVVLVRCDSPFGDQSWRLALVWFSSAGTSGPHWLCVAPVDSSRHADWGLHAVGIESFNRGRQDGLTVLRRVGRVLLQTWTYDADVGEHVVVDAFGASPKLRMVSTWVVFPGGAHLLKAEPADDATFAVVRAFDARHAGADAFPDHDVDVASGPDAWMRAHAWARLDAVQPYDEGAARVRLSFITDHGRADTLSVLVRPTGDGVTRRWEIR